MKNALRSLAGLLLVACGDSGAAGESQVGSTSGSGGTEVGSSTDESIGSSGTGTTVPTGGDDPGVPDMGPSGPPPVDYVIVTTDPLAAAAQRIADYRGETGHVVAVLRVGEIIGAATDPATASEAIRERVRGYHELRDPERAMFLLLVGDADDSGTVDATTIPTSTYELVLESVPAAQVITTDHRYADLDDDDLPELAVGRLPADSEAAVDAYLAKVKAAEAEAIVGPWNRRINMFAGSYGQGPLVDSLIEKLVNAVLDEISYDFDITMTYASQDSPYVYVPEDFSDQVYARINEGSLLVSYIGHGSADSFDQLIWSGVPYPILDLNALDKLNITHRSPIVTLIACAMGAFDQGESVSEVLLADPRGPAAVLSSTEDSDVYPNTIFVRELGLAITGERPATAGEAFMRAKQRVISQSDSLRAQIDNAFGLTTSDADLDALRRSHLYMYTLFGDPALQIRYPGRADVTATPDDVAAGGMLKVEVSAPGLSGAQVRVALESPRSQILHPLVPVPADGELGRDEAILANYAAANDKSVAVVVAPLADGALITELAVPPGLPAGTYHVKVYADAGVDDAFGSTAVHVK